MRHRRWGRTSGVWLILMLLSCGLSTAHAADTAAPERASAPPRTLVLLLDAVPFDALAEGGDQRSLFDGFHPPVPLISGFPSETGVALTGLFEPFGLERPPGYEVRFYDRARGRVRGGGPISYFTIDYPYHHVFDWKLRGLVRKAFAYAWPLRHNRLEIEDALEAFIRSDKPVFFAYVTSTDATGHVYGSSRFRPALEHLDAALRRTRALHPERPFYTVVLSDHGMGGSGEALRNIRSPLRRALEHDGWRLTSRLRRSFDVVLISEGLISSFVAYAQEGQSLPLAALLAGVEGVGLCAFQDREGWGIVDRGGFARIQRRLDAGQAQWAYAPVYGDPLEYAGVLERLRQEAADPSQRWFTDEAWFAATAEHRYPDALYRVARSFDLVKNPASAVCSVAPGHMSGAWYTELASRIWYGPLRWTHGSIERAETTGFLLTDHPAWTSDGPVRFTEALQFLATGVPLEKAKAHITTRER